MFLTQQQDMIDSKVFRIRAGFLDLKRSTNPASAYVLSVGSDATINKVTAVAHTSIPLQHEDVRFTAIQMICVGVHERGAPGF